MPESCCRARELELILVGHVHRGRPNRKIERQRFPEAKGVGTLAKGCGRKMLRGELRDDRVLRLADGVRQRRARPIEPRELDEVVGKNGLDAAVVANARLR